MSSLKFIPISGTTGVTENCYVYEYDNDMIVVDCGVGFPEPEMYGVDLIIPDFKYIIENKHKLRAIFITHGHEDHIGALPFLLKDVNAPIYATKLVAAFIQDKFEDYGTDGPKINVINPEKDVVAAGNFKVSSFRVSHSVPDGVGYCLETPEGKAFHVPDYKFDWTPVDGRPFDIKRAAMLANGDALMLASDSLGSTSPGHTESEAAIEGRIQTVAEKAKGQIFFTTISSNISRMQQAINVAQRLGRKVVFVGRSIDRKANIAKKLGYLSYPNGAIVTSRQAKKMDGNRLMYIISGSYGQPGSALYRVCLGDHESLKIKKDDVVVFSSDPAPPGSKGNVDFLVDRVIETGADVHYYDLQEDLHVSGHGSMEDIKLLFGIMRPKYFVPIGGTIRHNREYAKIAESMGNDYKNVFQLKGGDILELSNRNAKVSGHLVMKSVLVDGLGVGDVGNVVLRDRNLLAREGIAIVIIQVDGGTQKVVETPEIISRGFVFAGTSAGLLNGAGRALMDRLSKKNEMEAKIAREASVDFLERYFYEKTGRRPMVLPVVVEV
ncbi:MAG TPA: ribonuclease J [Candidatus Saccharimonadales bacterium]|nr:ribonuclease J [Candidatus Saccharimonadales bacterium]